MSVESEVKRLKEISKKETEEKLKVELEKLQKDYKTELDKLDLELSAEKKKISTLQDSLDLELVAKSNKLQQLRNKHKEALSVFNI